MKKIITRFFTFTVLLITVNCGEVAAPYRQYNHIEWMKQNVTFVKHPDYENRSSLTNPTSKYLKGFNANPPKPKGEAGCTLIATDPWEYDKVWGWGREQSWDEWNSPMTSERGIGLDHGKENSSIYIAERIAKNLTRSAFIYIGPWKYIPKLDKEIRLVATEGIDYGSIRSFFESKTTENAKIPEMLEIKLARSPEMNLDYCRVLWAKTYGYNAVVDLRKNPWWPWFSRKYFIGTGKVIEAKE